jgi:hypothetical protein
MTAAILSNTSAATELPEGVALSKKSLDLDINSSWFAPVK